MPFGNVPNEFRKKAFPPCFATLSRYSIWCLCILASWKTCFIFRIFHIEPNGLKTGRSSIIDSGFLLRKSIANLISFRVRAIFSLHLPRGRNFRDNSFIFLQIDGICVVDKIFVSFWPLLA